MPIKSIRFDLRKKRGKPVYEVLAHSKRFPLCTLKDKTGEEVETILLLRDLSFIAWLLLILAQRCM